MALRTHAPVALLSVLLVAGCDLWPLDHPEDPRRCSPRCSAGQRCVLGSCVAPDAGVPDAGVPDAPEPCGNGTIDEGEVCDGDELGGKTCKDMPDFFVDKGELRCASDCRSYDASLCHGCYRNPWNWPMCVLPRGTFTMGSPTDEPCREPVPSVKETAHQVTLTHRFEIMQTEALQIYLTADVTNPVLNPSHFIGCWNCPAENLTWHQAAAFCDGMSAEARLERCYTCKLVGEEIQCANRRQGSDIYNCAGYRLPTEAEWEYAARGGAATAYHGGANDQAFCSEETNLDPALDALAWYRANAGGKTHPAGEKQNNGWGLQDMAGNVAEWCHDALQLDLGADPVTDPVGEVTSLDRVARGGSWDSLPASCRCAAREAPSEPKSSRIGVRCVRTLLP